MKIILGNSNENYERGYPDDLSEKILSEAKLAKGRRRYKINKRSTKNFTVCTQKPEYRPSVPNLKNILMAKRQLIKNQPVLKEIFNDPPIL